MPSKRIVANICETEAVVNQSAINRGTRARSVRYEATERRLVRYDERNERKKSTRRIVEACRPGRERHEILAIHGVGY